MTAKMPRKLVISPLLLSLSSCGLSMTSSRETNPVIQGMLYDALIPGAVEYLAPTASRRLVLYKKKTDGTIMSCAEPPPDVGEAFAATVAGGAQLAAAKGDDTRIGASAQFLRLSATEIVALLYRTQGLQLYRDAQWSLCNDVLTGVVDPKDYSEQKAFIFNKTLDLIKVEIGNMQLQNYFEHAKATGRTPTPEVIQSILNAVKPAPAPSGDSPAAKP
jgi:hypothetical protein